MNTSLATADSTIPSDTATTPLPYLPQTADAQVDAVNDGRWGLPGMRAIRDASVRLVNSIRALGPYVAIELLLPGGTIIALGLWAYRSWRGRRLRARPAAEVSTPETSRAPLRCATLCTQR